MKKSEIPNLRIIEILPESSDWPRSVNRLIKPPVKLRYSGTLQNEATSLAIVGTRKADRAALDFTYEVAFQLAKNGVCIISGGARGIDAAAHQGALDGGGQTIAVLASGLRFAYPPEHADLFSNISKKGALVTEAEDDALPFAGRFIQRNRLIAALSHAVWVVQAPIKSGALHTARFAKKLHKKVFATPFSPWDIRGEGCLKLLQQDAHHCFSYKDLLAEFEEKSQQTLKWPKEEKSSSQIKSIRNEPESPLENQVLMNIGTQPVHIDEIATHVDFSISEIQSTLLSLTIRGSIIETSPGWYCRIRK